jgi:ferric-chelate reductase
LYTRNHRGAVNLNDRVLQRLPESALLFKMDMDNGSSSSMTLTPLNDSGVDFSNFTQAYNFQLEILDDTILQIIANQYATDFWYGIVVVIGIATIANMMRKVLLRIR